MLTAFELTGPVRDWVPSALEGAAAFGYEAWQWLGLLVVAVAAYPVGRFGSFVITQTGLFFAKRTPPTVDDDLVRAARRPLRLVLTAFVYRHGASWLELGPGLSAAVGHVVFTLFLVGFAWFAIRALGVLAEWAELRTADDDEIKTRAFRTQVSLLRRVATWAIVVVTVAIFLSQFEIVRSVGISLLASAGVMGIVLGLAAQKTIGAVIAGIQISMTQPVRIGDVVFVDKDWGEIEEINLTYVVVRLWDGRRQIIPINRFLDQPFENWTKLDTKHTGVVLIPVDFMAPLERLRPELERLCRENPRWDGRVCDLRVVDNTERTMTLRATVSAADPMSAAGLRHEVREGLITFLRDLDGGAYLPRHRVDGGLPLRSP